MVAKDCDCASISAHVMNTFIIARSHFVHDHTCAGAAARCRCGGDALTAACERQARAGRSKRALTLRRCVCCACRRDRVQACAFCGDEKQSDGTMSKQSRW